MTPYLLFEVAFIPIVYGLVKVSIDRMSEGRTPIKGGSTAMLVIGFLFLVLGLWGCYWRVPEVLGSGEGVIRSRYLVMSADRSRGAFGYWLLVVIDCCSSMFCAWLGTSIIWLYVQDRFGVSYWRKKGGYWQYEKEGLAASSRSNDTTPVFSIDIFEPKETLTVNRLHKFLWQTYQQFPDAEIGLPRTPMLESSVAVLAKLGCIKCSPVKADQTTKIMICQVADPIKSPLYKR